jgi:GR25 family glycosyltransferase involved in LPS biosynthesis
MFTPKNYLDGIDIIYWINLERAKERRLKMMTMFSNPCFKNIPCVRIPAIDGITDFIYDYAEVENELMTVIEYACSISHFIAIHNFVNSGYEVGLIMEDDMTLAFQKYWNKTIREIIDSAPNNWGIIQLCYITGNLPSSTFEKIEYNNENRLFSTGAYLIRRESAIQFIREIYNKHADKYQFMEGGDLHHQADHFIYTLNHTYTYKYPFFIYDYDELSSIHPTHIKFHNTSRKMIEGELELTRKENSIFSLLNGMTVITTVLGFCNYICKRYGV